MKKRRVYKIAEVVRQSLGMLIRSEVFDPRLCAMSITGVDVSPDLKNAKVWYVLRDDASRDEVALLLKKKSLISFFRCKLTETTALRVVPRLTFKYDDTLETGYSLTQMMADWQGEDSLSSDNLIAGDEIEDRS